VTSSASAVADLPSAAALAASVRCGQADPVALAEAALARMTEVDGVVGAFVHVDPDAVLAEAAERRGSSGPLAGVPVAVKDLFDVAGQRTGGGSRVPPDALAAADAVAVARLRAAGAVVVGRTRTHELAWGLTTWHAELGGTRNPHDPSRTAGGSSGGSAAAVAAGVVPLALGTDTGCSVRLPAAWCGLVGHRPTSGLVPADGVLPLAPSLDVVGPLARTVPDVVLALEVLSGRRLDLPAAEGLRVGRVADPPVEPAVAAAVEAAVGALAPAEVVDVVLPPPEVLRRTYAGVMGSEALAVHRARGWWPARADHYGDDVRARLEAAAALTAGQVAAAQEERRRLRGLLDALPVDVLVLPVAACGPSRTVAPDDRPDGAGLLRDAVLPWTVPANLADLPACAFPVGTDADGLPVGVQVVGRRGADALVLAAAARVATSPPG
jgi:Asp-tRNA(Asn)/Glu-tRNA(Gln) amidotransferase A subunit family amidase